MLLFLGVSIFLLGRRSFAYIYIPEDKVSMEVTYGYQNIAKGNRYVPLKIEFENEGDAMEGTLSVLSMEADYEVYEYCYPISLEAGQKSVETVHIPLAAQRDKLYLSLENENGKQIAKKRLKMDTNKDYSELFIGVLSDHSEKLSYFDNTGVYYSVLKTRFIPISAESFPEDVRELDLLDVLLITDFTVEKLSETQMQPLIDWVNQGGTLLLGTGARAEETLRLLDEDYMGITSGEVEERAITLGTEFGISGPDDATITLPCVQIEMKNGAVLLSSDDLPLLTMIHQEMGKIVVAAFDFCDLEQFGREQPSFVSKIFMEIYGEKGLTTLSNNQQGGNSSLYWEIQNMMQSGNTDKLPKVQLYTVVMALYVLLVGPGMYLFFKKRELGQFYVPSVILTSLFFTGAVYMMGGSTRLYSAFFSYATIRDTSRSAETETTYINVRVPYNKAYEVQLNPEYAILPLTRSKYYSSMEQPPQFTGNEQPQVRIEQQSDQTVIAVQDAVAFTPQYFQLERKLENEGNYFQGELSLFDGQVYGYVTNHYKVPIKNAAVLLYGKVIPLGDMQAGETREFSGEQVINYPPSNCYVAAQLLSGYDKYSKADINDKEYLAALERSNMISYYMQKHFRYYTSEAIVLGFLETEERPDFLTGQEYECFGRTMLASPVSLGESWGGYVYRSALNESPKVTTGDYYEEGNMMYGPDPLILEYSLGSDLSVEEVVFESLSDLFLNNEKYYYLSVFDGNMYFYNYNTGGYDLMPEGRTRFTKKDLAAYLSPENSLIVKYVMQSSEESYRWDNVLPVIYTIGRER